MFIDPSRGFAPAPTVGSHGTVIADPSKIYRIRNGKKCFIVYKGKQLHLLPASSLEANFWRICQTAFAHRSKIWKSFSIQNQQLTSPSAYYLTWVIWGKKPRSKQACFDTSLLTHYFGLPPLSFFLKNSPKGFLRKPRCSCAIGWYRQRHVREHLSPWRVPVEKQQQFIGFYNCGKIDRKNCFV